jgi:hypothetical protein
LESAKTGAGFNANHLAGSVCAVPALNRVEVLFTSARRSSAQVRQAVSYRRDDHIIAATIEADVVALVRIEPLANRARQRELPRRPTVLRMAMLVSGLPAKSAFGR